MSDQCGHSSPSFFARALGLKLVGELKGLPRLGARLALLYRLGDARGLLMSSFFASEDQKHWTKFENRGAYRGVLELLLVVFVIRSEDGILSLELGRVICRFLLEVSCDARLFSFDLVFE